jgi:hypothetical protein
VVTGDITEGRNGLLAVRPDLRVEMGLQRMEGCDQDMDVVDTNAHLFGKIVSDNGRGVCSEEGKWQGRKGRDEGKKEREGERVNSRKRAQVLHL